MRWRTIFSLNVLFVILSFSLSCTKTNTIEKNPYIESLLTQVSIKKIESSTQDLVDFDTRYTHEKQLQVAQYLYDNIHDYIYDTRFHEYEYWGVTWRNVEATIQGKKNPEEVVIVFAHLDSISDKRLLYAPGADDNASGCSAILELARILSSHDFEKTIRFVIFSREEEGRNGSKAYLKDFDKSKEKIIAAINLDMVAYGDDDEDIDLVTRPPYSGIVDVVYNLASSYGFKAKKVVKKACA